jgi:N-acetylneuraminate synthase
MSDHTLSNHACFGAVALGASILERHFTDTMNRVGPDIICSMDEKNCQELIHGSKIIALQRGGKKGPVKEEQVTIDFAFATVVTIKPVKAGELFTTENIWVKRPGTGEIVAEFYDKVLGQCAILDMDSDHHIKWSEITNTNI